MLGFIQRLPLEPLTESKITVTYPPMVEGQTHWVVNLAESSRSKPTKEFIYGDNWNAFRKLEA